MLFRKSPKPRKFSYEPRHYDPSKDERRRRIRFQSSLKKNKRPPFLAFVIALILFLIAYMALT